MTCIQLIPTTFIIKLYCLISILKPEMSICQEIPASYYLSIDLLFRRERCERTMHERTKFFDPSLHTDFNENSLRSINLNHELLAKNLF